MSSISWLGAHLGVSDLLFVTVDHMSPWQKQSLRRLGWGFNRVHVRRVSSVSAWGSLCLPGVISYLGYWYAILPSASTLAALGKNQTALLVWAQLCWLWGSPFSAVSLFGTRPMTTPTSVACLSGFWPVVFSCLVSQSFQSCLFAVYQLFTFLVSAWHSFLQQMIFFFNYY